MPSEAAIPACDPLSADELRGIDAYWRACNYLAVGMIYLQDNPLLRKPLEPQHVKKRLLGHWGASPGLAFAYVHLNRLIRKSDLDVIFLAGPGHGAPGVLGPVYLEGTYAEIYPDKGEDEEGMREFFREFSFPGGIGSHCTPETPGSIHEGGELGYSLSHAFGAAFDNPDLLVAVMVGDGEAETGPLATAWHSNKFLNPARDGAVLPILHLNGYKIHNPTLLARISHEELESLFRGYGWTPHFVEGDDPEKMHQAMAGTLERCVLEIRRIQDEARRSGEALRPRWPMIVLRSPKGERRMGVNPHADGGILLRDLRMPNFRDYAVDVPSPGVRGIGDTHVLGPFLRDVAKLNGEQRNFRVFGPDETLSNGLEALFDVTERQWDAATVPNDEFLAPTGRVMEMLSEHQCEGWLEGYLLTGRHGLFNCYEAFIHIIDSMFNQHAKWLTMDAAVQHCTQGIGIWQWASNDQGAPPDVVMACSGDVPTLETLAAVSILRVHLPELRIPVVNVVDLMKLQPPTEHPHGMSDIDFDEIFTRDKPVIFAFHAYPWLIHRLTYRRTNHDNIHVRGYKEEGTITTPFDMTVLNDLDRFHLVMDTIDRLPQTGEKGLHLKEQLKDKLVEHKQYIDKHGEDLPEIRNWKWNPASRPHSTSSHER